MVENSAQITTIDPSTARGALDEMIGFVGGYAVDPLADDLASRDALAVLHSAGSNKLPEICSTPTANPSGQ